MRAHAEQCLPWQRKLMLSSHCDNATDDNITQNISIFHGQRDQSHIIPDTNNTSRRNPISHQSKHHSILIQTIPILHLLFPPNYHFFCQLCSPHRVALCLFDPIITNTLSHGLFPSPDPKTPTMTLCAQLLFHTAKPHHVFVPKHLLQGLLWPAVQYAHTMRK